LVKNPASFNQVLDTLRTGYDDPWLMLVNDNLADGTDVSWLWDVDFEQLAGTGVNITSGGSRGLDLAVRLKYAGVDSQFQQTLEGGLDHLLTVVPEGARGYIIATYTAMLEIRKVIGRRTRIKDFSEWTHR
jgi:UDP-N-acetylmuramyl tripeptide synthase